MSFLVSLKVVRLFLAISVSVWLAGGCLFGCSSTAMASTGAADEAAVVEGESCHTARAHDCCSKPKPPKQSTAKPQSTLKLVQTETETSRSLTSLPRGTMSDCPLVISSTAVTSKNNSNSPDAPRATHATLPLIENSAAVAERRVVAPYLPNRGPTYLRCCAFLI